MSARLWVKVCGIRDAEAAAAAVAAGADAVGFVFAPGPRRVTPREAARIAAALPGGVARVGVFVGAGERQILEAAERAGLTHVQLHGAVPPGLPAGLRRQGLRVLRVLRLPPASAGAGDPEALEREAARLAADGEPGEPVLADTAHPRLHGGTGRVGDWRLAAALARRLPLVLAGGLTPDNVAEAVRAVRPWGVDVSSGVERAPGVKDPERVARFVAAARAAAEQVLAAPGEGGGRPWEPLLSP